MKFDMKLVIRWFKHKYQKIIRGFSDDETWSLDYEIVKFTLPRLKRFRKIAISHPSELTEKEWDIILSKIIVAFELFIEEGGSSIMKKQENQKQFNEGMELFGKYFLHLWW